MNLTVACVNHGNYLGQGQRYVDTLRAMVSRHLQRKHDFVCLEDVGKYSGWWAKIELFRPGRFSGRVLYLDLDSVVVGDLTPIVDAKGIINLLDWGWQTPTLCSSVMCWDAGEHKSIFELFDVSVPQAFRGDQDWMTHLGGWKALPKGPCVSYRYESSLAPPAGGRGGQLPWAPEAARSHDRLGPAGVALVSYYDNAVDMERAEALAIIKSAPIRVREETVEWPYTTPTVITRAEIEVDGKWRNLCRTDDCDDVCTTFHCRMTVDQYRQWAVKRCWLGARVGPERFAVIDACTDG